MIGFSDERFLGEYDRRPHNGNFISRLQKSRKGKEEMEMIRKELAVLSIGKGLTYVDTKSNGVRQASSEQS